MPTLPSRNRSFDLFEDPRYQRAHRAQRLIEAISRDLEQPELSATLRIRPVRAGPLKRYRLEYDNSPLRCARTSYLTRGELTRLRDLVSNPNGQFRVLKD